MMDDYTFKDFMSKKEWAEFQENYYNEKGNNNENVEKYLLRHEPNSFYFMITCAFSWGDTEQGCDYWEKISERDEALKDEEKP